MDHFHHQGKFYMVLTATDTFGHKASTEVIIPIVNSHDLLKVSHHMSIDEEKKLNRFDYP